MNSKDDRMIIDKLNILYIQDSKAYEKQVETLKGAGYRVFRNDRGQHKIEYDSHYFEKMFGGAFGGLI